VLAPLLLVAGPFIVPAALVVVANMVFATYLAQGSQVLELSTKTGGWAIELQAFFLISASLNKEKPRPL
jgi:putative oxidoreductase